MYTLGTPSIHPSNTPSHTLSPPLSTPRFIPLSTPPPPHTHTHTIHTPPLYPTPTLPTPSPSLSPSPLVVGQRKHSKRFDDIFKGEIWAKKSAKEQAEGAEKQSEEDSKRVRFDSGDDSAVGIGTGTDVGSVAATTTTATSSAHTGIGDHSIVRPPPDAIGNHHHHSNHNNSSHHDNSDSEMERGSERARASPGSRDDTEWIIRVGCHPHPTVTHSLPIIIPYPLDNPSFPLLTNPPFSLDPPFVSSVDPPFLSSNRN